MHNLQDHESIEDGVKTVVFSSYATLLERLAVHAVNGLLYLIPLANIYFVCRNIYTYHARGVTVGHNAMRLRFVSETTGASPSVGIMLWRYILMVLISFFLGLVFGFIAGFVTALPIQFSPLGIILVSVASSLLPAIILGCCIAFSAKKQAPYDKATGVIMVRTDNGRDQSIKSIGLIIAWIIATAAFYAVLLFLVLGMFLAKAELSGKINDSLVINNVKQAALAMELARDQTTGEFLSGDRLPEDGLGQFLGSVPSSIQWVSNTSDPFSFCLYAENSTGYFAATSGDTKQLRQKPSELIDCK